MDLSRIYCAITKNSLSFLSKIDSNSSSENMYVLKISSPYSKQKGHFY